jgi:ERCC4-related helicase
MPKISDNYSPPTELVLGTRLNTRVPEADQKRQRAEVDEILRRLQNQPGVILADEVGMGKTFVALAVAYSIAIRSPRGPVIVMVPANLVDKWEQDLKAFCELYLEDRHPILRDDATRKELTSATCIRYGVARHSVDLMKLLDDPARVRCQLIFLAQGAMGRRQTDKWVRLALIAEALRRHGRGKASRLIQVKDQIHRFLAELLWAIGEERAHDWGDSLWQRLLRTAPETWKDTFNNAVLDEKRRLVDDPVPKAVIRALHRLHLKPLAEALERMPVRARGGGSRVSERLVNTRKALRQVEDELWSELLSQARWRSPLLVMDEAHHLKNPGTLLARQLQSPDSARDLRTGDGAMANAFDRMLFLTATPFQLGHLELVRVLERFGDVRWDEGALGRIDNFHQQLSELSQCLNESQRTAIALQRSWSRLRPEDCDGDVEEWWGRLVTAPQEALTNRQRAVVDAYQAARRGRDAAQHALRAWIVRHNKGAHWDGTAISRRQRRDGAAIVTPGASGGLLIPPQQLLPFFLAARSAASSAQDLLSEALCSSYEAFRLTRQNRDPEKDEQDELPQTAVDLSHSAWYLSEFDRALEQCSGSMHPKISSTVQLVVDLWESGEKVLVFAFFRHTCRALRVHISQEVERRMLETGKRRLNEAGHECGPQEVEHLLALVQRRYFDDADSPGRRAVDTALGEILRLRETSLQKAKVSVQQRDELTDVMRRFLRVATTLVRCFPIAELDSITPVEAVRRTLDHADISGMSWRQKFDGFIEFLTERCSSEERPLYLEAASGTKTGGIRVEDEEDDDSDGRGGRVTLANVQVATGTTRRDTRSRLMRAFNTPFFPDILVCSQVMGEGVDLQRFCRHVIHHDLDWNPSTIEQRTGRVDRLGCKAEGRQSIAVYLPYLAGTADERQYRVMSDREQWFRVVMGQDEVARLITPDFIGDVQLPNSISAELNFKLGLNADAP